MLTTVYTLLLHIRKKEFRDRLIILREVDSGWFLLQTKWFFFLCKIITSIPLPPFQLSSPFPFLISSILTLFVEPVIDIYLIFTLVKCLTYTW